MDIEQKQKEQAWAAAIEKTKSMVSVKAKNQMLIAEIALSVCEVSWGGAHMAGKYTLSRFSMETGIHIKTLSHWCAVRRNVFERLPITKVNKVSFTKLSHVNAVAGPGSSIKEVQKAFEEVVCADSFNAKIRRQIADLRTLSTNFTQKNAAMKCDKDTLQEILFYTASINREIFERFPKLKPKSHGIAAMRIRGTSAAKALDIPRHRGQRVALVKGETGIVRISPKDREVALYLRKAAKFAGPTEIGIEVGKKSHNNATPWALRSLSKLVDAGIVERNEHGHYRFIP